MQQIPDNYLFNDWLLRIEDTTFRIASNEPLVAIYALFDVFATANPLVKANIPTVFLKWLVDSSNIVVVVDINHTSKVFDVFGSPIPRFDNVVRAIKAYEKRIEADLELPFENMQPSHLAVMAFGGEHAPTLETVALIKGTGQMPTVDLIDYYFELIATDEGKEICLVTTNLIAKEYLEANDGKLNVLGVELTDHHYEYGIISLGLLPQFGCEICLLTNQIKDTRTLGLIGQSLVAQFYEGSFNTVGGELKALVDDELIDVCYTPIQPDDDLNRIVKDLPNKVERFFELSMVVNQ